MPAHFSFPSIEQFRHVIKTVEARSKYHEMKVKPVITFSGTVKLHGTNAAIVLDKETGEMWAQSRERILTLEQDNAGFCQWFETNRENLRGFLSCVHLESDQRFCAVYGEWCGGNIQSGVAITGLEKMFVAFKFLQTDGVDTFKWFDIGSDKLLTYSYICYYKNNKNWIKNFYFIGEFPTYTIDIDFNNPELSQNTLVELTEAVEAECPVGKAFNVSGIGEGIVWTAISSDISDFNLSGLIFKVKGEKHSSSKVKTLAPIDVEVIKKLDELVDCVTTDNRLNQGLEVLKTNGVDIDDPKNTKEFIDWVRRDVVKEEQDTILASGLDFGKVMTKICSKAGKFYNNR